jgi:organic radical activating enzyme
MNASVKVIENFVSWQGEGPDSGRRMIILRFKTCNKKCPWCDTSVKMRITSEAPHSLDNIQNSIYENQAGIMVTGGEPTVDRHFDECLSLLNDLNYPIANVESNGFRLDELIKNVRPEKLVNYMFSPKIFTEADYELAVSQAHEFLRNPNVFYKLVYDGSVLMNDFMLELDNMFKVQSFSPFLNSQKVWVMPEGTTGSALIRNSEKVFDICEKYNFNFSSRNHIIYGFI